MSKPSAPHPAAKTPAYYRARPFLKWAGGKSQLLSQFRRYYPDGLADQSITRYVEPFLGSGAVFLNLAQQYPIVDAFLFDINEELILTYRVVQQRPGELIALLQEISDAYIALSEKARRAFYYDVRDAYNQQRRNFAYDSMTGDSILRAARMIFLNKTCYNGLYRVNSRGAFNVPFGRYERPAIVDAQNILAVAHQLKKATIQVGGFEACRPYVNAQTFVYFDPPYRPLNATSHFTSYSKSKFTDEDQIRLGRFFSSLDQQTGAYLMMSNSDPHNVDPDDAFFEDLYSGFNMHQVYASRMISSNARGRGKISELVITNY